MAFFVDSVDLDEVRTAARWGVIRGVTTNPKLLRQAHPLGKLLPSVEDHLRALLGSVEGEVFIQTTAASSREMVEEGMRWTDAAPERVVIKVPVTPEGLEALHTLAEAGRRTLATAIFSEGQAILAAAAGAQYLAPYLGRIGRAGGDPRRLLRNLRAVLDRQAPSSRILAASLATEEAVVEALVDGADDVTVPFSVLQSVFVHSAQAQALQEFDQAARELQEWLRP